MASIGETKKTGFGGLIGGESVTWFEGPGSSGEGEQS
jgi:hypothetical protein